MNGQKSREEMQIDVEYDVEFGNSNKTEKCKISLENQ